MNETETLSAWIGYLFFLRLSWCLDLSNVVNTETAPPKNSHWGPTLCKVLWYLNIQNVQDSVSALNYVEEGGGMRSR